MALVSMKDVSFAFSDQLPVMEKLSIDIQEGEVVALVGPSGSGKSTLFRILSGLLESDSGHVFWNDQVKNAAERLGNVSYVPQQPQLLPWRNTAENASISLEIAGMSRKKAVQTVLPLLQRFGLHDFANALPPQLSGGMRQRVSLMRAMLHPAPLLLMDEPFSALDSLTRMDMHDWLLELWETEARTVLLITHDIDEAILLADRILLVAEIPMRTLIEIPVPFKRPRRSSIEWTEPFMQLKRDILAHLGHRVELARSTAEVQL